VSVDICIDVFAGAGPWLSIDSGIIWLDDPLLLTAAAGRAG
jgi:hypothetical protein